MTIALKTLVKLFEARLSRQIVFWVSLSIILIEIIILLPSAIRREQELITYLEESVELDLALLTQENATETQNIDQLSLLDKLLNQSGVIGGSLTAANGEILKSKGQPCQFYPSEKLQKKREILTFFSLNPSSDKVNFLGSQKLSDQYQLTWSLIRSEEEQILSICYDDQPIRQEIYNYIFRISILVLIIAVWVALATMLSLQKILIIPIMQLRDDLLKVGQAVINEQESPKFSTTRKKSPNELDDVIISFQQMVQQVYQAFDEQRQAELALQASEVREREKAAQLAQALKNLQAEKMTALGRLVAGVAHEINNPVGFIDGNIKYSNCYLTDLLSLIDLYQRYSSDLSSEAQAEIQEQIEEIELDFIREDIPHVIASMETGTQRIKSIVLSLRTFSRLDESNFKKADLQAGLESTLLLLRSRIQQQTNRPEIQVIQDYKSLPKIECYPKLMNQVFMEILQNSIDAIED
ncbi:MAG: hypothetical protein AAFO04_22670, partial [Cyanobacteria bacterium J06592_8]